MKLIKSKLAIILPRSISYYRRGQFFIETNFSNKELEEEEGEEQEEEEEEEEGREIVKDRGR